MQFESPMFVAYWKRAPFLRLTVPLLAGIFIQLNLQLSALSLYILILTAFGVVWGLSRLPLAYRYRYSWAGGLLIFIMILCSGALLLVCADIRGQDGYFSAPENEGNFLLAKVEEPLQEKVRTRKTVLSIEGVYTHGKLKPVKGHLLAYFSRDTASVGLVYGARLLLAKKPVIIKNNGNPGAFDYRQYCAAQQIYHQVYLRAGDYHQLQQPPVRDLTAWLLKARDFCLHSLKTNIGEGPEAGMAEALLIGYRQDLDKDMVNSYSNTGIVHVIAISGMHLALLYGTLLWLLRWLPASTLANGVKALVILSVLWGFALLTGASASVLRAAVMFSGITIGQLLLNRRASTYNTLAASAFVLLCYKPWLAVDAGFQLSYLAVLSILLFYTPLSELLQFRWRWATLLWQTTALSIAAQILTLPVSIYYFHQFPCYFLPANLLAVPLSTVVIYGEVLLLLMTPCVMLAEWTGLAIRLVIRWMNAGVEWLGELPYAVIGDLQLSLLQTGCFYALLAGLAVWWLQKFRTGLWVALVCGWAMVADKAVRQLLTLQRQQLIIYNVPAYTAIDCIGEGKVQFIGSDSLWQMPAATQLRSARTMLGVTPGMVSNCRQHGRYLHFGHKRLLIIDSALPVSYYRKGSKTTSIGDSALPAAHPSGIKINYLLLNHNSPLNIRQLREYFRCDTVIFGAACSSGRIRRWTQECRELKQPCYSIPDEGACMISF
ncbi:ComEC/Rec2 family competence protein [Chitinophaga sp. HK235]|uniref:ComEC/Rec2 family competence protein n=1 Tax=Chitinophaga sp. HK235 TaxID=2952571 RepID=UPI001BACAE63|nr:ComEC/Rec2 family competence protein [Chitinophaga sp. HK235]